MSAQDLLERLRTMGVSVRADGEDLCLRAPVGVLTPDLRGELAAHKQHLLLALQSRGEGKQGTGRDKGLDPEVAWRVAAMRPQVPAKRGVALLVARRGIKPLPGECTSCGEPLEQGNRYRCELCVQAAWEVLREKKRSEE